MLLSGICNYSQTRNMCEILSQTSSQRNKNNVIPSPSYIKKPIQSFHFPRTQKHHSKKPEIQNKMSKIKMRHYRSSARAGCRPLLLRGQCRLQKGAMVIDCLFWLSCSHVLRDGDGLIEILLL